MGVLRTIPLKQGDLDWLCSIYAAINLGYLRGNISDICAADKLFKKLIAKQLPARKWNIGRYVTEGVDPNPDIVKLFEDSGFSSVEPIDPSAKAIEAECRQQPGVLIYFEETTGCSDRFSHYTIAIGVSQCRDIKLYDSWKFERLERVGDGLKAGDLNVKIKMAWRIG